MTDEEFFRLKVGTVVSCRFDKDTYYVVNQEDVFGNGNDIPDKRIFGARELDGARQIRISKNNAKYWSVQGRIKKDSMIVNSG
ncbi:MAG: hypothetical protein ACLUDG_08305 [Butyricicoccus sp.]